MKNPFPPSDRNFCACFSKQKPKETKEHCVENISALSICKPKELKHHAKREEERP